MADRTGAAVHRCDRQVYGGVEIRDFGDVAQNHYSGYRGQQGCIIRAQLRTSHPKLDRCKLRFPPQARQDLSDKRQ